MGQTRFGIRQLMIDGQVFLVRGGGDYAPGGDKKESVMGLDRRHGVKITRLPGYFECTIVDTGKSFDLHALVAMDDVTVMVDLENGKTIKLGHACYVGEGKVTGAEGEVESRFECDPENFEEM